MGLLTAAGVGHVGRRGRIGQRSSGAYDGSRRGRVVRRSSRQTVAVGAGGLGVAARGQMTVAGTEQVGQRGAGASDSGHHGRRAERIGGGSVRRRHGVGIGGGVQGSEGVRRREKKTTRKKQAREKEEARP